MVTAVAYPALGIREKARDWKGILRFLAVAVSVIAISSSGAVLSQPAALTAAPDKCPKGSKPVGEGCIDLKPVFIEKCPGVRKALRFYTKQLRHWTLLRTGAPTAVVARSVGKCPRYLVKVRRQKAAAAHREWNQYFTYHWVWSAWLPDKWRRIGICETGLNWRHSNSSYEGAFGFALSSWDSFVDDADPKAGPYPSNAYLATPRQQYEVALAIWRRYGLSGWGCRGA